MTAEETLNAISEGLVIGPDDVLVLRVGDCSPDQFDQFHATLREGLPSHLMSRIVMVGWPVEQIARMEKD